MIFKLMWVVFFFFFFSFYDKFDFIRGENTIASAELTDSSVPDTSLPACGQLKFYISHGAVAVCLSRQRALQLQTLSARSLHTQNGSGEACNYNVFYNYCTNSIKHCVKQNHCWSAPCNRYCHRFSNWERKPKLSYPFCTLVHFLRQWQHYQNEKCCHKEYFVIIEDRFKDSTLMKKLFTF